MYSLELVVFCLSETFELDEGNSSFRTKCQSSDVTRFICKHVGTAYLKSESSQELHYILPFEEAKKGHFEKLFLVRATFYVLHDKYIMY